uniref:galactosylceramidase n=1 Tax=Arion vulgaris TaxID=1028688 RepID=A0A0B7BI09_9EUPU
MLNISAIWTVFILLLLLAFVNGQFFSLCAVDDFVGVGRRYDGIGGLSGGSATSKLLIGYPDKQRNEVLDYLFKPKFAASLQILKVEIGGDSQASDATEASHMHVEWEENYQRGYEWWLMEEAKKRNPDIKLFGLPWAFPGWVGNGTQNPYYDRQKLATYIYKWIRGADVYHNLTIDYIGMWNERWYDAEAIKVLRKTLDDNGYSNVFIVASDLDFGIVDYMTSDAVLSSVVDFVGAHYPGVLSPDSAKLIGKQLWSSEDFSTVNDEVGGGCWARILNQNYVQGLMTSTISWNLIDSFFEGLPWDRTSLMTAREPWSGNYVVESPIWMSAHTTQFTEPGWRYLPHGHGVGMLNKGGSYVTIVSPDLTNLTIVIEAMSHDHSICIRPELPAYTVTDQVVIFNFAGAFENITELYLWYSMLTFDNSTPTHFQSLGTIAVSNGQLTLIVEVDHVYTLTTVSDGQHGQHDPPPPSAPFPLPFVETFEEYPLSAEPYLLAPQQGSYDVVDVGGVHKKVMRQMVLQPPIVWCVQTLYFNATLNLLGRFNWTDVEIAVDVKVGAVNGTNGVYIGARIDNGGCTTYASKGIFFFIFPNDDIYLLANDIKATNIILAGRDTGAIVTDWNRISLSVKGSQAVGSCNGVELFNVTIPLTPANGLVGVGTDTYGYADFDNIELSQADGPSATVYSGKNDKKKTLLFETERP